MSKQEVKQYEEDFQSYWKKYSEEQNPGYTAKKVFTQINQSMEIVIGVQLENNVTHASLTKYFESAAPAPQIPKSLMKVHGMIFEKK